VIERYFLRRVVPIHWAEYHRHMITAAARAIHWARHDRTIRRLLRPPCEETKPARSFATSRRTSPPFFVAHPELEHRQSRILDHHWSCALTVSYTWFVAPVICRSKSMSLRAPPRQAEGPPPVLDTPSITRVSPIYEVRAVHRLLMAGSGNSIARPHRMGWRRALPSMHN
jgi:hypothetical protein